MTDGYQQLLTSGLPDAAIVTSVEGLVPYWNKGAEVIFGYMPEERVGKPIFDLIIPKDRIEEERWITRETVTGKPAKIP